MFSFTASFDEGCGQQEAERSTSGSTNFQPQRSQLEKQPRRGQEIDMSLISCTRFDIRRFLGYYRPPDNLKAKSFTASFDEGFVELAAERLTSGSIKLTPQRSHIRNQPRRGQEVESVRLDVARFELLGFTFFYLLHTERWRSLDTSRRLMRDMVSRMMNSRHLVQPVFNPCARSFRNSPGVGRKSNSVATIAPDSIFGGFVCINFHQITEKRRHSPGRLKRDVFSWQKSG